MALQRSIHNEEAYRAAVKMMEQTGRAAILHPAGTEKEQVALRLIEEHPDAVVLWLSPEASPVEKRVESLCGAKERVHFHTYIGLTRCTPQEWVALAALRPAYIVLEEFHQPRSGGYAAAVFKLLGLCPQAQVLGLSGVCSDNWEQSPALVDELFRENIASELTLGAALVQGLLPAPCYTVTVFMPQPMLTRLQNHVKNIRLPVAQNTCQMQFNALRTLLNHSEGIARTALRALTCKNGKYLVFCPDREQMKEKMAQIRSWLSMVNPKISIACAAADEQQEEQPMWKGGEESLKLLFCTDPAAEEIEGEGFSGAILFRSPSEPLLYQRQLGCALSACTGTEPQILDVLCDFEAREDVLTLQKEVDTAVQQLCDAGKSTKIWMDRLEVEEPTQEARKAYEQLKKQIDQAWERCFAEACAYYAEHGALNPPKRYLTQDRLNLGAWVIVQRQVRAGQRPGELTEEQIERLDSIGMKWKYHLEIAWGRGYLAAKRYRRRYGDLLVPVRYTDDEGFALGEWIVYNRQRYLSGGLSPMRTELLQNLGMVWDTAQAQWQQNYLEAVRYYVENGSLEVPVKYTAPSGAALGVWLGSQRAAYKAEQLTPEQIAQLEALNVDWTDRNDRKWQTAYQAAVQYYKEHGHLNVPAEYIDPNGVLLGKWISRQRYARQNPEKSSARITEERRTLLDAIGMQWIKADPWRHRYKLAMLYKQEHGNLEIPTLYKTEDSVWLGTWVCRQRSMLRKNSPMTAERRQMLEELFRGERERRVFQTASGKRNRCAVREQNWQKNYRRAKAYYKRHGDLLVPAGYVDETGCRLGVWISNLRAARKKRPDSSQITQEHVRLLDAIGMEWDARAAKWECALMRAAEFHKKHGHLQVPVNYKTEDGFCLGDWIRRMRESYHARDLRLTEERERRLSELGMVWEL